MKQEIIPLSELPVLTPNIKRAICLFAWSLYDIDVENEQSAQYMLKTSSERFLLRKDGNIIRKIKHNEVVEVTGRVFFKGFVLSKK